MKQHWFNLHIENDESSTPEMSVSARCTARTGVLVRLHGWLQTRPHLPALVAAALGVMVPVTGCGGGDVSVVIDDPLPVSVTVPMQISGTHTSVLATINGTPMRFGLDTGADFNVVSARAAEALGLVLSKDRVPGSGGGGSIDPVPWTQINDLAVGNARQRGEIAFVIPLSAEFPFEGFLGANFFRNFSPRFDYERGELTLTPSRQFKPPLGITRLPIQVVNNQKILVEATAAGVKGWYSVDTGQGSSLTIFTPTVERNGLRDKFKPIARMNTGITVSGREYSDVVRLPEVIIGPYRFTDVVTELSLAKAGLLGSDGWMGNLGAEIFRRFTVTIDYATRSLYLEPNAAFGEAFRGPRAGFSLALDGDNLKVFEVVLNTPASEAGVLANDIVLMFNGRTMNATTRAELQSAMSGPVGSKLVLRLRGSGGVEREATVVLREFI
jgi:predicted aspartyl protease